MQRSERNTPPNEKQPGKDNLDPLLQRQKQLGAQLRAAFAHVAEEPVPEEFLALIDQFAPHGGNGGPEGENGAAND